MQGYPEWARRYARLFSLNRPEDGEMFVEWENAFEAAGFTAEDLQAAANELVMNAPQTRPGHLKALVEACRRFQSTRREKSRPDVSCAGPCAICLSSGWVIVPHVGTMRGTLKGYHTMAVACMCARGKSFWSIMAKTPKGIAPVLTLEKYEQQNPEWRTWIKEHEEDRLTKAGLGKFIGDPDGLKEELMRRNPKAAKLVESVEARLRMPPRREYGRQPPPGQSVEEWLREEVDSNG